MPRLGRDAYPFVAAVRWYIEYLRVRALARQENTERRRMERAQAELLEAKVAEATGLTVPKADVVAMLSGAYLRLGKFLDNLPAMLAREFNLPPSVAREMRDRIDDARRSFVRDGAAFVDVTETGSDGIDAA